MSLIERMGQGAVATASAKVAPYGWQKWRRGERHHGTHARRRRGGRRRDDMAELLDRAVKAWRAPRRILGRHPADESADVDRCARVSSVARRFSTPLPSEAFALRAHDGCGLHDGERLLPSGPPAAQSQPGEAVDDEMAGPGILPLEDGKLLAGREVLDQEISAAGEDREKSPDGGKEAVEHPRTMTAVGREGSRARPRAIRVSCKGAQLVEGQGGRGFFCEGQLSASETAARIASVPSSNIWFTTDFDTRSR